jgi:hypothetical protein
MPMFHNGVGSTGIFRPLLNDIHPESVSPSGRQDRLAFSRQILTMAGCDADCADLDRVHPKLREPIFDPARVTPDIDEATLQSILARGNDVFRTN